MGVDPGFNKSTPDGRDNGVQYDHSFGAVPRCRRDPGTDPITTAQGRQILFYSPVDLLGGTLTCSRCGASGRQPDVIEHDHDCSYGRRPHPVASGAAA